jgi:prepilin-type N-terminal cleavage/methylation domain-containing protein
MTTRRLQSDAGFSLPEVMVAMALMLFVLAGTFTAMTQALRADRTTRDLTTLNGNLRASMDLVVRDFLQVGQGLPTGRTVGVPNGPGATPIVRPGPAAVAPCVGVNTFPAGPTLSAVTPGPDLGPPINGQCTDVITTLAADGAFENVNVSSIAADGQSITVYPGGPDGIVGNVDDVNISDNPDASGDNVRVGDVLLLIKGATSVMVSVTAVAGQTLTFTAGDPLNLNQFDVGLNMLGTTNQLKAEAPQDLDAPAVVAGVEQQGRAAVTRVRMITYFVNTALDPTSPRLMRAIGGNVANVVGFELEAFRMTYDIADGVGNPVGARMTAADLAGGGACGVDPCSANQVRKANVVLAIRSRSRGDVTGDFYHNTLFTQVALRSLAFVDRY